MRFFSSVTARFTANGVGSVIVVAGIQGLDGHRAAIARAKQVVRQADVQVLAARGERNAAARFHLEDAALQFEAADGQLENVLHGGSLAGAPHFRLGNIGAAVAADDQVDVRIGHRQRLKVHILAQDRHQLEFHHHALGAKQRRFVRRFRPVKHEAAHLRPQVPPIEAERCHFHAPAGGRLHRADDELPHLVEEPRALQHEDRRDAHQQHQPRQPPRHPKENALPQ